MANKYNLLILGSGRSGTSMFTGAIAESGFFLGEKSDYLKPNKGNPKGFFEDYEVNTINEEILRKTLFNFPEKFRKLFLPSFTFYRARWLARIPCFVKIKSNNSINKRIQKVLVEEPFCYKDPRFSYTLPVWQKYLSTNTRYVVMFRNPLLTAQSIVRECRESSALNKLQMNEDAALKVWKYMYRHILENYRKAEDKSNWKFIHFEQMFEEGKLVEIEQFIEAEINKGFAERNISRSSTYQSIIQPEIAKIYSQLNKLANNTTHF